MKALHRIHSRTELVVASAYVLGFSILSVLTPSNTWFWITISLLFALYFIAVKKQLRFGLIMALLLIFGTRIPFFFDLPVLTTDFYRYLWDGMLMNEGINPIGRIPIEQNLYNFKDSEFAVRLLNNMNSGAYASIYPTFHQVVFAIAYFLGGPELLSGVNVMRGCIIVFELFFFFAMMFRDKNFFGNGLCFCVSHEPSGDCRRSGQCAF